MVRPAMVLEVGEGPASVAQSYYDKHSKHAAAYDELLNIDEEQQAETASREIQGLVREAMNLLRPSTRRGESP